MSATTVPARAHPGAQDRAAARADARALAHPPGPAGNARLLSAPADATFAAHLAHWGPLDPEPRRRHSHADLVDEIADADLRGRGGAGFPTARKMAEVRKAAGISRRPVVVANGTESELVSSKDRVLLATNPHLVLDGMVAAARAVGAREAILCVKDGRSGAQLAARLEQAIVDRAGHGEAAGERVALSVSRVRGTFVAGEETALVNWLNGGAPLPTLSPPRPAQKGVRRRPTLVDNVETLAHVGLIARFGAAWWRHVGADDAGTTLLTVTGAVQRPGVLEVPVGTPLADVLDGTGALPASAVLVGGYFGTWLSVEQARTARLSHDSLRQLGAGLGCGAIVVLAKDACPLAEMARVAHWLAAQSAGQCGPCVNGLPAIAGAVEDLATRGNAHAADAARRWADMVRGRGACKLPDGAVGFVTSGLDVFADHVELHRWRGPCHAEPVLPVARTRRSDHQREW